MLVVAGSVSYQRGSAWATGLAGSFVHVIRSGDVAWPVRWIFPSSARASAVYSMWNVPSCPDTLIVQIWSSSQAP
jgi:hypothetical protein